MYEFGHDWYSPRTAELAGSAREPAWRPGIEGRVGARAQREDSECLCGPGAGLFQDATLMISDQDRVHARAWLRVRSGNRGRRHRCHTRRGPRCAICAMLPVRRAAASAVLYVLSTGARRCGGFRVAASRPLWRPAFCRTRRIRRTVVPARKMHRNAQKPKPSVSSKPLPWRPGPQDRGDRVGWAPADEGHGGAATRVGADARWGGLRIGFQGRTEGCAREPQECHYRELC